MQITTEERQQLKHAFHLYRMEMAKLTLPRSINEMSIAELNQELNKRHIANVGRSKQDKITRLQKYLEYPWVQSFKHNNQIRAIRGFIREQERLEEFLSDEDVNHYQDGRWANQVQEFLGMKSYDLPQSWPI